MVIRIFFVCQIFCCQIIRFIFISVSNIIKKCIHFFESSIVVFLFHREKNTILILFFFISFMEDSGYLARASFVMDRLMHKIGLHGKSFIPLVMGFGCNVPAVISSRIIESRSSRLITVFITPFMSCSARLPVFVLLSATFSFSIIFSIFLICFKYFIK